MKYQITKTYGHNLGLSACFRQHRADSHCRFLHGYALSFKLTFEAATLNAKNWVVGFGDLKEVKQFLEDTFDHKTVVAADDPMLDMLLGLDELGLAQIVQLPRVGCEAFAQLVYNKVASVILSMRCENDAKLISVECREHEGNSAIYIGDDNAEHKGKCYRASCATNPEQYRSEPDQTGAGGNTEAGSESTPVLDIGVR